MTEAAFAWFYLGCAALLIATVMLQKVAIPFSGLSQIQLVLPLNLALLLYLASKNITYISRQGGRRSLVPADHDGLVAALDELAKRRGWKFIHIKAQEITKEHQLAVAAGTTVCPFLGIRVGLNWNVGPHRRAWERPHTPGDATSNLILHSH